MPRTKKVRTHDVAYACGVWRLSTPGLISTCAAAQRTLEQCIRHSTDRLVWRRRLGHKSGLARCGQSGIVPLSVSQAADAAAAASQPAAPATTTNSSGDTGAAGTSAAKKRIVFSEHMESLLLKAINKGMKEGHCSVDYEALLKKPAFKGEFGVCVCVVCVSLCWFVCVILCFGGCVALLLRVESECCRVVLWSCAQGVRSCSSERRCHV